MALGQILQQAREAKGLSTKQVAEATRMLVQIVESLEREDFSRIAAPLYGRGFIRLYAECVGLDPEPLLVEFMEIFSGNRPPQIARRGASAAPAAATPKPRKAEGVKAAAPEPRAKRAETPEASATPPAAAVAAEPAASDVMSAEVMPLDPPAVDAEPDLFMAMPPARPPVAKPIPRRAVTSATGNGRPPAVRPFSGKEEPDVPEAPAVAKSVAPSKAQKPKERVERPKINVAPVLERSKAVGRELVKIWNALPLNTDKKIKTRAAIAAAVVVAVIVLVFIGRAVRNQIDRQASSAEPVHSQRILPPPLPYVP